MLATKEIEHQPFLKYSDVGTIDGPLQRHPAENYRKIFSHSLVLIFTSLWWMAIIFLTSQTGTTNAHNSGDRHNITSHATLLSCGNSTNEARALGCQYDILLNHWVPASCADTEFIVEYKDDGSWGAFADANMTQKITTVEEMSERDFYYTSVRDHINHCGEMWKKQFYVLFEEQRAFDSIVASPRHTDHCAQYLMDVAGKNITESTRVEVGFAGCWVRG